MDIFDTENINNPVFYDSGYLYFVVFILLSFFFLALFMKRIYPILDKISFLFMISGFSFGSYYFAEANNPLPLESAAYLYKKGHICFFICSLIALVLLSIDIILKLKKKGKRQKIAPLDSAD